MGADAPARGRTSCSGDPVEGGWFSTTGRIESVLLRLKEDYDGAEPSATSVTVLNLLTLSHLTNDHAFEEAIDRGLGGFASRIEQGARTVPMMMAALSAYHAGMSQIVIAGDPAAAETRILMDVVRRRYLPFVVLIPLVPSQADALARLLPWIASMSAPCPARVRLPRFHVSRTRFVGRRAGFAIRADLKVGLYIPS